VTAFACPRAGCAGVLVQTSLTELVCGQCRSSFWLFGGQLMDGENRPVHVPSSTSARKPTPKKPIARIDDATVTEPVRALVRRDPATVTGTPTHVFCPECRAELLEGEPSALACPGCGGCYWRRGGEIVREGEVEATEVPETQVPVARARIRKHDD
jgi:Zn-finger nucleic acid-binding protein